MLFMVIEHFRDDDAKAVYAQFRERGRLIVDEIGLSAVGWRQTWAVASKS